MARGLGAVRGLRVLDTVLNPGESPHHFHTVITSTLQGGSRELVCCDLEGPEFWGSHSYVSSRPSRSLGDWAALPPRRCPGGRPVPSGDSKPEASMVDPPLLRPWRSGPCAANLTTASLAAQPAPHDPGTAWPPLVAGARETSI